MHDIQVLGTHTEGSDTILTYEALTFVAGLHHRFDGTRRSLLSERETRQVDLDRGIGNTEVAADHLVGVTIHQAAQNLNLARR